MSLRGDIEAAADQLDTLFRELSHENDRVAAITCAAWLDDTLSAAIATRFINLGKEWKERVFDNQNAPLSTFSGKIVIGYALALFGSQTRADLDIIRWVRNQFAHHAQPVSFDRADISEKCLKIKTSRDDDARGFLKPLTDADAPKEHYLRASLRIGGQLLNQARANHTASRPKPPYYALP